MSSSNSTSKQLFQRLLLQKPIQSFRIFIASVQGKQ
nr:MAG TPA: hypothetical protein [Bacteriophage sp.]